MQSEIIDESNENDLLLTEPHFDDEATLLSARPVVPLDEVSAYEPTPDRRIHKQPFRVASGWMYAITIVAALLLGMAGSALYYSRSNQRANVAPSSNLEIVDGGVEGKRIEIGPANPARNLTPAPDLRQTTPQPEPTVRVNDNPAPTEQPAVASRDARKPVARRVDVLTSSDESDNRDELKATRRAAKQRIRELERETRNRRSGNDLTRIRDIFEGPQKP